jgi:hypothetical protein
MARPFFSKILDRFEKSPTVHYNKEARFKKPAGSLGITLNCGDYYNSGSESVDGTDEESGGRPGGEFDPTRFQDETPEQPKPNATPAPPPSVKPATTPTKPTNPTAPPKVNQKSVPQKPKPDEGFQNK